jgi:hypothetical protein
MQAYMSLLGRVGEARPSTPSGFLWVRNDDARDKEHKWVEHWVSLTENRLKRDSFHKVTSKGAVRRSLLMYDPKGALARFADDARELLHIGAGTEVEVSEGRARGGGGGGGGVGPSGHTVKLM